ncbi:divalent anion:Na+ symporter (DASS) family transporter [Allomyces macrogynus ATCC 38327]|uniref:Divalent anion:Na+ symporter (DASS) family transporter n=1 Tax=Allomyces macrogynus (strain ATCC 38327) TaxID=578462 RepID=A0A0L0RX85_ALLM3|nr:divalent anion:Na+ symporter (DASS) family transporter [Allomyces macrogynus ATCC 38327]|eukprot:KNE54972.1 divalent anion:Na+ symporter (DASS) family transporter [Allomyces macrogynus ATCC 38327]
MKFSHQLRLNSVPDWADSYIAYSHLKKYIYALERVESAHLYGTAPSSDAELGQAASASVEATPLLGPAGSSSAGLAAYGAIGENVTPDAFVRALDAELDKIVAHYVKAEKALADNVEALRSDIQYAETVYWTRVASTAASSRRTSHVNMAASAANSPLASPAVTNGARASGPAVFDVHGHEDDEDDADDELETPLPPPNPQVPPPGVPLVTTPTSPLRPVTEPLALRTTPMSSAPASPLRLPTRLPHSNSAPGPAAHSIWTRRSMQDHRVRLGRRAIEVYVALCDLRDYASLNQTGFSKILKKFDKVTQSNLRKTYLQRVQESYPWQPDTQLHLQQRIEAIELMYAHVVTLDDVETAQAELKTNLRQHVAYERNTVWRDMMSRERRVHAVGVAKDETPKPKWYRVPVGFGLTVPVPRVGPQLAAFLVGVGILVGILQADWFDSPEQQACLAILLSASWMWGTEALPLFVTSLCIPMLVVMLRVMRDPETLVRLDPHSATKLVFGAMFSPVIMLLLGGFTIAAALSKHFIAKILAVSLLSKAGTKTIWVLLANMFVATFASMWISNVAAPVLCFSIVQPILRTLPPNSSFGSALILGIALASNIGGMASPISSPQNVVAIQNMSPAPTWAEWFMIALPICVLTNVLTWILLVVVYQPHIGTPEIVPLRASDDKLTGKQWLIILVTGLTIFLWCIESALEPWVGDMGIIAFVPLVVFFGTGILSKEDFNSFLWTVIMLAMGGIALGKAVENSGLLVVIATQVKVFTHGMSLWSVLFVFSGLVLVVATFISHTVAALIVLPIVSEVGSQMADPHPRLLVMGAALMCSGAMGLPVSGFPNLNAISQEDAAGTPYLKTMDFVKVGIPASVGVWATVLTVGFGIMLVLGF